MEDVLDLYMQPADPARPLVCFDETSKGLHEHYRLPTPARPGRVARYDYQYHMVESGEAWDPVRAWHIPDTDKHSFRTALARALGIEAYPGDWYLAS